LDIFCEYIFKNFTKYIIIIAYTKKIRRWIIINTNEVVEGVKKLAKEVGKYQYGRLNKELKVVKKTTEIDLVSEVDKNSEKNIINWIQNRFPLHNIVAEESGTIEKESEYTWIIDPLDGTTNYIHGFPLFSISIALMKNDDPILGVIYVPYMDELYSAVKNNGAYLNNKLINVSNKKSLQDSLLVTGFPYDMEEDQYNNVEVFNKLLFKSRGIRRIGSAAYDLACIAAGRFDGFWEFKLNAWDVKAGVILIKEAGGKVLEVDFFGHYLIIAGSADITDKLYNNIKDIYNAKKS